MASVAILLAVGFGLTLLIFYPGVMTYDAKFVYEDIAKGTMGDWQSPVMVWLWGLIDPIAPGAGSMFLLIAATYWLGFGVLSLALASRGKASRAAAAAAGNDAAGPGLAGIIWRDVLFATCWLLAAAVAFAVSEQRSPDQIDRAGTGACIGCSRGPVEAERLARPRRYSPLISSGCRGCRCAKTAILYIPAVIGFFGIVQLVYYGMLDAKRQHPLQTIMIFDLGGISHFAKAEPVSGRLERVGKRDAAQQLLPANPVGHLLAARAL